MDKSQYTFCLNGNLLEYHSLFEIKSQTSDEEWDAIVNETVSLYASMQAIYNMNELVDKNDLRLLRSLKRSVLKIGKIDPLILKKYDPVSMVLQNTSIMKIVSETMKNEVYEESLVVKTKSI